MKTSNKYNILVGMLLMCITNMTAAIPFGQTITLTEQTLLDKIKGGWAGQTIGCTYGGPTEFKYKGAFINDKTPIIWYDDYCKDIFEQDPGLYDDVYMDLTFLEVMQHEGINAPAESYAKAFANANYKLWHANQAARYNILHGIMPPASGHWKNNPHADDIDFQIESDFIGMICPGMPNAAARFADRIGHIMNYGDGYYGGVFMSAMYTYAFVCDDIEEIVSSSLKSLPSECKYRRCIEDVVRYHQQYPDDWKRCWLEVERNYSFDIGCPEGVYNAFDIDAVINGAYCVMGLLYGDGDFDKTIDISTRCGQDSDCNPATAAGILGVIKGWSQIPDKWKAAIDRCGDIDFPYTHISLNSVYDINLKLLKDVLIANGGKVRKGNYIFEVQQPMEVAKEESFGGLEPLERQILKFDLGTQRTFTFTGCAVVLQGLVRRDGKDASNYIARLGISIDGIEMPEVEMPFDYIKRKYDIYWNYDLTDGRHSMIVTWLNPHPDYAIQCKDLNTWKKTE